MSRRKKQLLNRRIWTALELTREWDKTFPQSDRGGAFESHVPQPLRHYACRQTFISRKTDGSLWRRCCQRSLRGGERAGVGRYAQTLAEQGFLTIAFDPSYYGESGGTPRYLTSPEISTEDFSAAVDYLSTREDVDPERIGILGICGWGGFASAAANDPRVKATVTSTMYDMSRVNADGYFDAMSADDRYELRERLNAQRTEDYRNGSYKLNGGVVDPVPEDAPLFVRQYHDYYKTARGYHRRSPNSNGGITETSALSFINMPILSYIGEIRSPVLLVHGEKAHSRYFSEDAYKRLTGDNKELLIVPGANHVDLYDNPDAIPFDRIGEFFRKYLMDKR